MTWLVMPAVGSCVAAQFDDPAGSAGPIAIEKPVGQGGLARNRPADVRIIQEALNQVTANGVVGGPIPFLAVDGLCGPKTIAAIINFQKLQVQVKIADGVVEPGKQTILRLNEIVAPLSQADLEAKLEAALPLVRAAYAAALADLRAIITSGPAASGPAAVAADRLNRHFRLGTLGADEQSEARVTLFETYQEHSFVASRPDLFGMANAIEGFDIDRGNAKFALTSTFGVFAPPTIFDKKTRETRDNPARHIHLGLSFFSPTVSPDFAAFIILHEISHFASRRDGVLIDDHGRGWFDDTFIVPLPAQKRLANADSFATFAHECRTGSAVRPPFVKTAPGGLGGAR